VEINTGRQLGSTVIQMREMVEILEANLQDVDAIASLFHNTIRRINFRDYTPVQIETWAGTAPEPEKWRTRMKTKQTFIASRAGELVGFVELETDGHVDALYVHHDHQGEGIASHLLKQIEKEAMRSGIIRLYTEASITARHFFERRGFVIVKPQEVDYHGVKFKNYRMEKRISAEQSTKT